MNNCNPPATPRKKLGCWFYGCTTLAVLSLVGLVVAFFAVRYFIKSVNQLLVEYTDTQPVAIERVQLPPDQFQQLQQRVDTFTRALESGTNSTELVLSATDLNALISQDPKFKDIRDKVFVVITGDQVKGQVSFPLPDVGPLKMNGRYLNGLATFTVSLQNGQLNVTLSDVEVKGRPLPANVISQLKGLNLAQDAQNNPETRAKLQKFESIQIRNGSVVLRNYAAQPAP